MILEIFTDGGSKGNPGPSSIGVVFYRNKVEVHSYRKDIGIATNNYAEYTAVLSALNTINTNPNGLMQTVTSIRFYSDSMLLVNQLNGVYKVKNSEIREFILKIRNLEGQIGLPIQYRYIPREQNKRADDLVNNK